MPSDEESLSEQQLRDAEIRTFVSLRLEWDQLPGKEELQSESKLTKQLVSHWSRFEVHDSLIYQRYQNAPKEEGDYLQLFLPRTDVRNVLNQCHRGVLGGHFRETKTMDQVQWRFYWHQWKEDVCRFCLQCLEYNRYHRRKLRKQGLLQPVIPTATGYPWSTL